MTIRRTELWRFAMSIRISVRRLAFCLLALALPAAANADYKHVIATKTIDVGSAQGVSIDFPVGELRVVGVDGDNVEVRIELRCKHRHNCDDAVDDSRVITDTRGEKIRIRVEGPKWHKDHHFKGYVEVPRSLALDVDMNVGELEIDGLEQDLDVHLSVGEVDVDMPESAVRSVDMDVSIGDASLRPRGGSSVRGLLGKEIRWGDGQGKSRVEIQVSVGDATLRLW